MSKSYKLKGDNYIDSTGIVHDSEVLDESNKLNVLLESMLNRDEGIVRRIAGYGQVCKQVTGDWDTACGVSSGFYMGSNLNNSPNVSSTSGWFHVIHLVHNANFMVQLAFSFSGNHMCMRTKNNTWSNWQQII